MTSIREAETDGLCKLAGALHFAAEQHRMQRRKDAERSPYINHPIALLNVLVNEGNVADTDVLCAAVLHDVIEDCAETAPDRVRLAAEIEDRFGERVLGIVKEVTDDKDLDKAMRKCLQIEHAGHLSKEAQLVKLADKIVNIRDVASSPPGDWSLDRRREYFDWAQAVISAMGRPADALGKRFEIAYAARP
jgi:guanosine-3',5'-bis(diphosphate) 3'-pyrophosphohydrolase